MALGRAFEGANTVIRCSRADRPVGRRLQSQGTPPAAKTLARGTSNMRTSVGRKFRHVAIDLTHSGMTVLRCWANHVGCKRSCGGELRLTRLCLFLSSTSCSLERGRIAPMSPLFDYCSRASNSLVTIRHPPYRNWQSKQRLPRKLP